MRVCLCRVSGREIRKAERGRRGWNVAQRVQGGVRKANSSLDSLMLLDWHRTVFFCKHATGSGLDGNSIASIVSFGRLFLSQESSLAACFLLDIILVEWNFRCGLTVILTVQTSEPLCGAVHSTAVMPAKPWLSYLETAQRIGST